MKLREIQDLIKIVSESGIDELSLEQNEFKLSIINNKEGKFVEVARQPQMMQASMPVQQYAPAPITTASNAETPVKAEVASAARAEIKSPIVGTFYRSASPDKPAYIKVGDKVQKGQVVCIVEAMKLFNEIESEVSGTVVKVMVEDAQPVEYDQVLYLVE